MKLTPLDIHHKEFHRSIRGYSEEEVDKFLDEVAEGFERLFKENIELKEQLEKLKEELDSYSGMEKTLQNTLLTAQKSAEEIVLHAKKESELVLRDAELKSKEVLQEAYDLKRKYEGTLNHLKQAEEEFRGKFKSMLESYMRIADSTAVLAEIGTNIVGLEDKPSAELENIITLDQDIPKIGIARVSEEVGPELMPPISSSYVGESYSPDDLDALLGLDEPGKHSSKNPKSKDIQDDIDKPDTFDIDSLAF